MLSPGVAVPNGALGFFVAIGKTVFGAVAKFLGENIALTYTAIALLTIGCGVIRGLLQIKYTLIPTRTHCL